MKTLFITLIIIVMVSTPIMAGFNEWTNFQKGLGLTYAGLIATDLRQSQHWIEYTEDNPRILDNGYVYENNPIVAGKTIEQATAMAIGANYLLYKFADNIDSKYRTILLIGATLIEGKVVYDNHKTMERFNFEYKINFISFGF